MWNDDAVKLLVEGAVTTEEAERILEPVGFDDPAKAHQRFQKLCLDEASREALTKCLPMLLAALTDAATADGSLINFDRYVQSVSDRRELFEYLASNPRAVEILVKLFVGSQFLTEILLRNPDYLQKLVQHKRLADFKSRSEFYRDAYAVTREFPSFAEKIDELRRFQQWELLRLGACDSFNLMDLKSVTVQLSLLADSLVQVCLTLLETELNISVEGFVVLAMGKLGGEELNYSSDIDLIFLTARNAQKYWGLAQRLITALNQSTGEGFLYRVDMRLRPWGRSGTLVNSVDAHVDYLHKHGRHWEKQALLKARPIAGTFDVGRDFLKQVESMVYGMPPEDVRQSIVEMKQKIEADLKKQGKKFGHVKAGTGSIRDVEFTTQYLQLIHGLENPAVRSINTLDGLVRLAEFNCIQADEYRHLTSGYLFLRTIEHALQLMHHKQVYELPDNSRELAYLAGRLDFQSADQFLKHYQQHCAAIRKIYSKYLERGESAVNTDGDFDTAGVGLGHRELADFYAKAYTEDEIKLHDQLLALLSDEQLAKVDGRQLDNKLYRLTIVGYDQLGELSLICGLLSAFGFDIVSGHVFTHDLAASRRARELARNGGEEATSQSTQIRRKFVNTFTLKPPLGEVIAEVWYRYEQDLLELLGLVQEGRLKEVQGRLASRVALQALRESGEANTKLLPVEIRIDNDYSEEFTVLDIQGEDTVGFLYELTNALAIRGIHIERVLISGEGTQVSDVLYVTNERGERITNVQAQQELRAAIVLIKHFTHLLPLSPNPEAALLHFRQFVDQLSEQPDWVDNLTSLSDSNVLDAIARLLGVSNFLWEDFLRLQHDNLFPVLTDVATIQTRHTKTVLAAECRQIIESDKSWDERCNDLNAFRDREMFRADMRHILGHIPEFGQFSHELTDLAEVVVDGACQLCAEKLNRRYGLPIADDGKPCSLSVCALGKCGGRELGFASDIELMFVYDKLGKTAGPEVITATEYFLKFVERFTKVIHARDEGIFHIDLRLRPYGRAGSLAVSLEAFEHYFGQDGAAWPYERQALVKLRPISGDVIFGRELVALRDQLVYTGEVFDVAAMRAMRQKQITQLVKAGTFNAKLAAGGLVDCEYVVQGLQITHGKDRPELRTTNTTKALNRLHNAGILPEADYQSLRDSYIFLRRLIDALRMVRGNARDLTVPSAGSDEFQYLARRLGYQTNFAQLELDIERHSSAIHELSERLLQMPKS